MIYLRVLGLDVSGERSGFRGGRPVGTDRMEKEMHITTLLGFGGTEWGILGVSLKESMGTRRVWRWVKV